ncbi:hypothetical protein IT570_03245 [Candidatus Sumerlaeota bacterium]|nr:hypothetical protein [Candidatus Sumerlaeota bacterium]
MATMPAYPDAMGLMAEVYHFKYSMDFAVPVRDAFEYFTDLDTIARTAPASLNVRVLRGELPLKVGSRILFGARPRLVPLEMNWLFQVTDFVPDRVFADTLLKGPVERWTHRQDFMALTEASCRVGDWVEFTHPTGIIGRLVPRGVIEAGLPDVFAKREAIIRRELEAD